MSGPAYWSWVIGWGIAVLANLLVFSLMLKFYTEAAKDRSGADAVPTEGDATP